MINPEIVKWARDCNKAIAAIDWARVNYGLRYALTHGGNLPPGFMKQSEDERDV